MKQKPLNRHIDLQRRLVRSERSPISTWPLKCRENLLGQPTKRCSSVSVCMYLGDHRAKNSKSMVFLVNFWHGTPLAWESFWINYIITAYCFLYMTWLLLCTIFSCLSSFPMHFVICSSIRLCENWGPKTVGWELDFILRGQHCAGDAGELFEWGKLRCQCRASMDCMGFSS